jgi:hypothetical protein
MSTLAAIPAALPPLYLCRVFAANPSPKPCDNGGEWPSFRRVLGRSNDGTVAANFHSQRADENCVQACVCCFVSRLLHGHCFGAYPAPCGSSLFCFGYAALRVTVSVPDPP